MQDECDTWFRRASADGMWSAVRPIFTTGLFHAGGGLFTNTNPEVRRVVPEDVKGRTKLKVVYVVLEAQYQAALTAAVRNINATRDKVQPDFLPTFVQYKVYLHRDWKKSWTCSAPKEAPSAIKPLSRLSHTIMRHLKPLRSVKCLRLDIM